MLPPYVSFASPHRWVVANGAAVGAALEALGFTRGLDGTHKAKFRRPLSYEPMAVLAMRLRDLGAAFSAGSAWSPALVALDLRERGLFTGPFDEIVWAGDDWVVLPHPA